jgi:hypothetical protein
MNISNTTATTTAAAALLAAPALFASSASAGFTGWTAAMSSDANYIYMDVFAGFDSAADHVLNVFDMNIAAQGTSFYQAPGMSTSRWAPGAFTSTDTSTDSFVTIGDTVHEGVRYAGTATAADPSFSNYNTFNATSIPTNAGWYSTTPLGPEGGAVALSAIQGKQWFGQDSQFVVRVAHFVFTVSSVQPGSTVSFVGSTGYRTGSSTEASFGTDTKIFQVPAPGAIALLGVAGLVGSRRRR